ncbi:cytochrome P450 [Calocera viscosa TUFC12733]|uniref:Cytochrome P450 n=1 Tax=Calocera viscosa (strain TUFC12733) TaxID=1330018 RepID=A0A167KSX3_CALVF|nr:cytochrome P450 [Calocera viscosa TUFC12733]
MLSVTLVILATSLLIFACRRLTRKPIIPLPPGPKGLPLLGSALDLPKENEWLYYSKLHKTYGDIIHFNVLGQSYLVVGSLRIASDLLEKRSAIYSGRIHLSFGGSFDDWKRSMLLQEGPAHRGYRRFAHKGLSSTAVKQYEGLQEREALKTLQKLLDEPEKFLEHFKWNTAATILLIAYGYQVQCYSDPFVLAVRDVMDRFSTFFAPGNLLMDYVPMIKYLPEWLPGMSFKKTVWEFKVQADKTFDDPYEAVKKQMAAGTAVPCLTTQLLEEMKSNEDEAHITGMTGSLFLAGSDTSASALSAFMMAMILYPEVQKKAQQEIDAVVGADRLPAFLDRNNLPYVDALVKEVLRWHPIAPIGFPHRLIEEDHYEGYRIPKDTLVITNIWHMARDEAAYGPDPERFKPERFLGSNAAPFGYKTAQTQEFGSPAFGFGRRLCPGQHIAMSTLFILCSNILATMTVSPEVGDDGSPILPKVESTGGVIV